MTRSQVRPWASITCDEPASSAAKGMYTTRLLTRPTGRLVKPAMDPCTAFCPSSMQYSESIAIAGTERT